MRFSPACLSLAIVVSFGAGDTAQSGSNSSVPKPPTTYQTPHDSRDQLPQVGGSIYMMGQPTKVTILFNTAQTISLSVAKVLRSFVVG